MTCTLFNQILLKNILIFGCTVKYWFRIAYYHTIFYYTYVVCILWSDISSDTNEPEAVLNFWHSIWLDQQKLHFYTCILTFSLCYTRNGRSSALHCGIQCSHGVLRLYYCTRSRQTLFTDLSGKYACKHTGTLIYICKWAATLAFS